MFYPVPTSRVLWRRENTMIENIALMSGIKPFFLGVRIKSSIERRGVAWLYPGTRMREFASKYEITGNTLYLNHNMDVETLIRAFKGTLTPYECTDDFCYIETSYMVIPAIIERVSLEPDDRIRLDLSITEKSYVNPENVSPVNRFASLLYEALIALSRILYFCGKGEEKQHREYYGMVVARMKKLAGSRDEMRALQELEVMAEKCPQPKK